MSTQLRSFPRQWRQQQNNWGSQTGQWPQSGQRGWWRSNRQGSQTQSQSALSAFQTALANASSQGIIGTTQASQLQSQAANANNSQLQQLTQQIYAAMMSGSPSGLGAVRAKRQVGSTRNRPKLTTTSSTTSTTSSTTSGSKFPGRRGRSQYGQSQSGQSSRWQGNQSAYGNGYGGGYGSQDQGDQWQQSYSQSSDAPTQTDLAAFQQALAQASALGVISSTQVSQIQAQANDATDSQIQSLTQQINSLISSASISTGTTATTTAAAATTSTSWWDGTTSIFGATVSNSTLAIGAGVVAVLGYAIFKKR